MPYSYLSRSTVTAPDRYGLHAGGAWRVSRRLLGAALCSAAVLGMAGCGRSAPAQNAGGMPPPTVGVITVARTTVALQTELPGRLDAWRTAQVRARVAGIVQKRLFVEGAEAREGQSLYQLEDATYQANVASAQAALARAEAAQAQAQAQYQRNQPLVEAKAISQQEWVATQATLKQSQADVASAQASLKSSRINLDYSAVRAPISGRLGRSEVSEGALVGPTDTTALTTIQQLHPLYVNFTQSASEVLRLQRALASGQVSSSASGDKAAEVQVVLEDGSVYPLKGRLLFADRSVDPSSGQIRLRAELPNPQRQLLPGLFVRVRLSQATAEAFRIPQQAVTRGAQGDTVLVVDAQGKVTPRPVKVIGSQASDWIVESGLNPGEQVVADGFQRLQMARGAPVKTVPWAGPGASGAGAPGGAASGAAGMAPGASGAASAASAPASAASAR